MNLISEKNTRVLDYFVYAFIVIFLLSVNNSIFLNQIGYYGALLLLLIKYFLTRKNPFTRNGLEIPLLLFLAAELISAILSQYPEMAFHNFFKRILLIPIVYVISSVTDSEKKAKQFLFIYLTAAFITILAYVLFAYDHFISQLYQLEAKGPSPFQYVMTAGGLISFVMIYLFAFLVNEKSKFMSKILLLGAFLISVIALMASYTRAAWLGAAAGVLIILIIKKKWLIIVPLLLVGIFLVFYPQPQSFIKKYQINGSNLNELFTFNTGGRAFDFFADSSSTVLADYENGVIFLNNNQELFKVETPSPATDVQKWENYYFVVLVDKRMILIDPEQNPGPGIIKEFSSPGKMHSPRIVGNFLYTPDIDSGLTVYKLTGKSFEVTKIPELTGIKKISADSNYFAGFFPLQRKLELYRLINGLPSDLVGELKINTSRGENWLFGDKLFVQVDKGLKQYNIIDSSLDSAAVYPELTDLLYLSREANKFYALTLSGEFLILGMSAEGTLEIQNKMSPGIKPTGGMVFNKQLFITHHTNNRVRSIFDPYFLTNIERIYQWKTGFRIFADYPFFGVGDIDLQRAIFEV